MPVTWRAHHRLRGLSQIASQKVTYFSWLRERRTIGVSLLGLESQHMVVGTYVHWAHGSRSGASLKISQMRANWKDAARRRVRTATECYPRILADGQHRKVNSVARLAFWFWSFRIWAYPWVCAERLTPVVKNTVLQLAVPFRSGVTKLT